MQTAGMKGGRVYLPYAFIEQGVYMLMTVLKGELAIKQSKVSIEQRRDESNLEVKKFDLKLGWC